MMKSLHGPLFVGCALSIAGCGSGPTPGIWRYDEYSSASNTCNSNEVELNNNGDFRIFDVEGGAFRVDSLDGNDEFECELDGDEFDCPERFQSSVPVNAQGVDATLEIRVRATGTFDGSEAASGEQVGTVTCTGSGCDAIAAYANTSFPCQVSADFEAVLDEAE